MAELPANLETPCFLISRGGLVIWANTSANASLGVSANKPVEKIIGLSSDDASRIKTTTTPLPISIVTGSETQTILAIPVVADKNECVLGILLSSKWVPTDKRSELLASVAHDLKNPMGAIFGYADALIDTPIGLGMTDNQKTIVERIRTTSARAVELVRNYQQLARMEYEPSRVDAPIADLTQIVKDTSDMTWRESDPTLRLILEPEPIPVRLGKIELERILANLLTNAQKFTPKDGVVTIKTKKTSTSAELSVSNTGSFIPASENVLIFERYGRGAAARDTSGTGLGLFIIKEILTRRGGTIRVNSSEAEGTTFILELPLAS